MASISASVELYDRMSAPLMSIMNAMNMTISSMRDMQSTMASDMDTSSLDAATQAVNQAQAAMEQLNETARQTVLPSGSAPQQTPSEPPTPSTEPVQVPVEWVTNDLDVFSNSGMDRFQQEVNATNQMLTALSDRQNEIAQNAAGTDIFSDSAMQDINSMGQRIQAVQQRIQQIENNPVNLGTDTANAELEQLRSQLNQALQAQEALNQAVDNMDVSAANAAYNQLSSTVASTERYIRDNADAQGNLNQQIQAGVNTSNELVDTVKRLAAAYLSIQTLSSVIGVSDELTQTIARLNLMNDGAQTTQELFDKIYLSALSTHSPLMETANAIAKMGNNAGAAFSSNDELIAFMEQVNKQFAIGGASATEQSNAIMQLSQAMASGALRGDELNSILDAAPGIARTIEESMGWAEGSIKSYAEEGKVTAEVVKSSLLNMANETNAAFESMPITFSQVMTDFVSSVQKAFQPVLNKINELANNEQFQVFVESAVSALATLAVFILDIMNTMSELGAFIADNWSIIEPIVLGAATAMGIYAAALLIGKGIMLAMAAAQAIHTAMTSAWSVATFAATVQQQGLNSALAACPITWIILLIIAVIAAIFAVCNAIAKMTGVANSGFGVIMGCIFTVGALFKNLGLTVANIALGIGNALSAVASNMMTAFHNAICSVQSWFYNLLSTALTVIEGICAALNKLPFVEFDYSGISSAADDYASKAAEAAGNKEDYKSIGDAFNEGMSTFDTFQDGWAADAFNAGASWGDGVADKVSGMFSMDNIGLTGGVDTSMLSNDFANNAAQTAANTADTADSAGRIADSVDISKENLKYLRDIAETEAINRFTTAEITVSAPVSATISSDMDIDGVVDHLSNGVLEAMERAAEGVHI